MTFMVAQRLSSVNEVSFALPRKFERQRFEERRHGGQKYFLKYYLFMGRKAEYYSCAKTLRIFVDLSKG
jgi:hypothetical protein